VKAPIVHKRHPGAPRPLCGAASTRIATRANALKITCRRCVAQSARVAARCAPTPEADAPGHPAAEEE
jgi:hypothetical protein